MTTCFAPAGVLAPKSKADFAFVLHALSYLSARGRAAICLLPRHLRPWRRGTEDKEISCGRQLCGNGHCVASQSLLWNEHLREYPRAVQAQGDTKTQFIDASGEDFCKKQTNNNVLTDEHIERIVDIFDRKAPVEYVAALVDNSNIAENGYNLSVSSYVEAKDTREVIDIARLNAEVKQTVERIDALRADIDAIIKELEDEDELGNNRNGFSDRCKAKYYSSTLLGVMPCGALTSVVYRCTGDRPRRSEEEQQGKERADYGAYLIKNLAQTLEPEYGSGFSVRQLEMCRQFYRLYPIANALRSQLNWNTISNAHSNK